MDEASFLAQVRASLSSGRRASSAADGPIPTGAERATSAAELAERLTGELEQVGGIVRRVESADEVRHVILQILGGHDTQRVVLAATPMVRELGLAPFLAGTGMEVTVGDLRQGLTRERIRDAELVADAGITSADYGVAETGTLALVTAPGQGRAVSLLPPIHIAVLRSSDIVYELSELFRRVQREHHALPSALTFITGPSRTADIELVLTVGVHGPKHMYLVLWGD